MHAAGLGPFAALREFFRPRRVVAEAEVYNRGLIKPIAPGNSEFYELPRVSSGQDTLELIEARGADHGLIQQVRMNNLDWLTPWEATAPPGMRVGYRGLRDYSQDFDRQVRLGLSVPLMVVLDGRLVGQLTVSGICRGALQSAAVGYWVAQCVAGHGVTTLALAMAIDYCLSDLELHRVEVNIRPSNRPSLRMVEKLGLPEEGLRRSYIHIAGQWRDHRSFCALSEDMIEGGLVVRLERHLNTPQS